jgi:hypothetical protein
LSVFSAKKTGFQNENEFFAHLVIRAEPHKIVSIPTFSLIHVNFGTGKRIKQKAKAFQEYSQKVTKKEDEKEHTYTHFLFP